MKKYQTSRRAILLALAFAIATIFLNSLIYTQWHDWDIDSFLYLGARLNDGHLIYVKEFETKLPLVQYIFWLPSKLGGIGAWRIITLLLSILFGGLGSYLLVEYLFRFEDRAARQYGGILLTSIFILMLYSLPGSVSAHIEMISAAAMYCSIALLFSGAEKTHNYLYCTICTGFLFAVAAFIRPNYLYTLPSFFLVYAWSLGINSPTFLFKKYFLFLIGFTSAIILMVLPYFFIDGGLNYFLNGLIALGKFPQGISLSILLFKQFHDHTTNTFYIFLYSGIFWILGVVYFKSGLLKNSSTQISRVLIFSVISIVAINFSFLRTHYSNHYSIMFVPFAVILSTSILWKLKFIRRVSVSSFICTAFLILISVSPIKRLTTSGLEMLENPKRINLNINDRGDLDINLMIFLKGLQENSYSFLVDGDTIYHRLLNEGRIGDGHPAILEHILQGNRVNPIDGIYLLSTEVFEDPCLAISRSGKDFIILKKGVKGLVFDCLAQEKNGYREADINWLERVNSSNFPLEELFGRYRFFSNNRTPRIKS